MRSSLRLLYILEGKKIVKTTDLVTFGEFFNDVSKRRIGYDTIEGINISTVFLGIDHSYLLNKKPLLFETMSFSDFLSPECIFYRYAQYRAAFNHHQRLVKIIKFLFNSPLDTMPTYINVKDFRGEIALHRLKRGY